MENPFFHFVEDFEEEAEAFLKKYECADAVENPRRIPIRQIAARLMSLDIVETEYLSPDDSTQGAIAFSSGTIEVYDWSSMEYTGYQVSMPTIFVDADIINPGRINNTLAHECYHWWRHRNYFNYKRIHEKSVEFGIRCNRYGSKSNSSDGKWSDVERMEWQARTIAPKILMPMKATKKKIEELYMAVTPLGGDRSIFTEQVITSLADFFAVSKQSAAIRMTELGYSEASKFTDPRGTTSPSGTPRERRASNAAKHQRPITVEEAFKLYLENESLRETIDTGVFCFADGYFVLRDDAYVQTSGTTRHLTDYAKLHLAECTLDFAVRLVADEYLMHDASSYMMYRSDTIFKEEKSFDANTQNTDIYNKAKDFEKKLQRSKASNQTATELLWKYMQESHWNTTVFLYRTNLSPMDYSRVQQPGHKFKMPALVAMGVGLELDLHEMEHVLTLAGLSFMEGDREQQAYKYLFTGMYGKSIDECNEFLEKVGVKTLGSKQRA
jgi:Zn-dependent peptidase ImmA (M78 family)